MNNNIYQASVEWFGSDATQHLLHLANLQKLNSRMATVTEGLCRFFFKVAEPDKLSQRNPSKFTTDV